MQEFNYSCPYLDNETHRTHFLVINGQTSFDGSNVNTQVRQLFGGVSVQYCEDNDGANEQYEYVKNYDEFIKVYDSVSVTFVHYLKCAEISGVEDHLPEEDQSEDTAEMRPIVRAYRTLIDDLAPAMYALRLLKNIHQNVRGEALWLEDEQGRRVQMARL